MACLYAAESRLAEKGKPLSGAAFLSCLCFIYLQFIKPAVKSWQLTGLNGADGGMTSFSQRSPSQIVTASAL